MAAAIRANERRRRSAQNVLLSEADLKKGAVTAALDALSRLFERPMVTRTEAMRYATGDSVIQHDQDRRHHSDSSSDKYAAPAPAPVPNLVVPKITLDTVVAVLQRGDAVERAQIYAQSKEAARVVRATEKALCDAPAFIGYSADGDSDGWAAQLHNYTRECLMRHFAPARYAKEMVSAIAAAAKSKTMRSSRWRRFRRMVHAVNLCRQMQHALDMIGPFSTATAATTATVFLTAVARCDTYTFSDAHADPTATVTCAMTGTSLPAGVGRTRFRLFDRTGGSIGSGPMFITLRHTQTAHAVLCAKNLHFFVARHLCSIFQTVGGSGDVSSILTRFEVDTTAVLHVEHQISRLFEIIHLLAQTPSPSTLPPPPAQRKRMAPLASPQNVLRKKAKRAN
jgi:hypothetical protein